ncbi:MAG TPA: hypothetical protein VFS43_23555 [Polyangiaceae bacterium]|nr:hypothetical protein [Polyangiaceae bacterium]
MATKRQLVKVHVDSPPARRALTQWVHGARRQGARPQGTDTLWQGAAKEVTVEVPESLVADLTRVMREVGARVELSPPPALEPVAAAPAPAPGPPAPAAAPAPAPDPLAPAAAEPQEPPLAPLTAPWPTSCPAPDDVLRRVRILLAALDAPFTPEAPQGESTKESVCVSSRFSIDVNWYTSTTVVWRDGSRQIVYRYGTIFEPGPEEDSVESECNVWVEALPRGGTLVLDGPHLGIVSIRGQSPEEAQAIRLRWHGRL